MENSEESTINSTHKAQCCATSLPCVSSTVSPTVLAATTGPSNDLEREPWYTHHPHASVPATAPVPHLHSLPHTHSQSQQYQQLSEEFVMYGHGLPTTCASPSISKYGIDTTTESYLNARYNVNVKGVRHERSSSFFDIPAVTHPYCYRFPSSPPAGILKKNDDELTYCSNNGSNLASCVQFGQHITSAKIEYPDSTTTHFNNHQTAHHHHHHHHHHQHSHNQHHINNQSPNLHHAHAHQHTQLTPHASAFKFSHTSVLNPAVAGVYQHYGSSQSATAYNLRTPAELSSTITLSPASTTDSTDVKYDNPYSVVTTTSYGLRQHGHHMDSTTVVSSTDPDFKIDNLYSTNPISTTQTATNQRRGSLQLWQFLVALLDEPTSNCIAWTGRGMEFKLIEPEEVARRWGIQKNRPAMNYDKLSRSLRYYYEKGIMQKVNGERYVYRFVCDPEALFNMAYGHLSNISAKTLDQQHQHQHHQHHQHRQHDNNSSVKNKMKAASRRNSQNSILIEENQRNRSPLNDIVSVTKTHQHHEQQLFYGKF